MTSSDVWASEQEVRYDDTAGMFRPEVVGPTVDAVVELAGGGAALQFAIGTGRIGVPLRAKGVPLAGLDCPSRWVERLRMKASR